MLSQKANDIILKIVVREVLENIIKTNNIDLEIVKKKQKIKRTEKGGFEKRIYLKLVEEK